MLFIWCDERFDIREDVVQRLEREGFISYREYARAYSILAQYANNILIRQVVSHTVVPTLTPEAGHRWNAAWATRRAALQAAGTGYQVGRARGGKYLPSYQFESDTE